MDFEKLITRCIDKMSEENLTNKDVAHLAQISEATVSRVLSTRGAFASTATITAICDALGIEDVARYENVSPPDKCVKCGTCIKCEARNQARIDDLKAVGQNKERWICALAIACAALVAFILVFFAVDMLSPAVGWIRA